MSTVTAHTLFSRAATYSAAGATSRGLGCLKPAVVSVPLVPNSGKKTPRSVCNYADPKSSDHPTNIPPASLVQKCIPGMPRRETKGEWTIKEDDEKAEVTFFNMPDRPGKLRELTVAVEGNVLKVSKKKTTTEDDVTFDSELVLPDFYDKEKITAEVSNRNLVVTIPKYHKDIDVINKDYV